jgi:hypothetical protein
MPSLRKKWIARFLSHGFSADGTYGDKSAITLKKFDAIYKINLMDIKNNLILQLIKYRPHESMVCHFT